MSGSGSARMMRTIGVSLVAALLSSAAPVLASPASTTSTPTASSASTSSVTTSSTRAPADTRSEIELPSDSETAEFRAKLAEKQARLDEFTAQLDELDRQLEIASEDYNAAVSKMQEMKAQVQAASTDLENARHSYDLQAEILGTRASSMYKSGSFAAIEVLLESKSMADFVARVKFLNAIGIRDADIAQSLEGQRDQLQSQVGDLESAEAAAASLELELNARRIEIMLRIQERQQLLSAAQTDLLELLDEESSRRRTEESALLSDILAGANAKGITVEAGGIVETALAYHGIPYLWGGETTSGFDCSGLVLYVFRQHGVALPHYSGSQFLMGEQVPPADLRAGDVVFFGSPIHHVGIYIGGGYFIHAPRTGDFVKISRLADRSDYAGARRYAALPRTGMPEGAVQSTASALSGVR